MLLRNAVATDILPTPKARDSFSVLGFYPRQKGRGLRCWFAGHATMLLRNAVATAKQFLPIPPAKFGLGVIMVAAPQSLTTSRDSLAILAETDPVVYRLIQEELNRQRDHLEMIASENFTSPAVLAAQGSVLTNKYAEGLPGKRYYGGCEFIDEIEQLAIDRAKQLFGAAHANVQPHSGAQANFAVFLALLQPGDTIMGMDLAHGGHLTHGSPVNVSGKWFRVVHYGVHPQTEWIDFDQVRDLALQHRPKLIICGYSAYPRTIDFAAFRAIADQVGAYLLADIAHIAGLVATGHHPNPVPLCDVVTTTTHKTLRGPRGGLILTRDPELGKKLDKAVFPGSQGGAAGACYCWQGGGLWRSPAAQLCPVLGPSYRQCPSPGGIPATARHSTGFRGHRQSPDVAGSALGFGGAGKNWGGGSGNDGQTGGSADGGDPHHRQ